MTSWINSGGDQPRLCNARVDSVSCEAEHWRIGGSTHWMRALRLGCAVLLVALAAPFGHARDRGQFVNTNAELKAWFDGLRSGKGP